ncbi:transmembrane protein, putative (macronuclear) [Tetrahymena thermophila SB210]|uniref:Transmembrane protein, putative n=1 Tax=Tetrahymena thermophila (strain SB210) TaxID=312017 RepID=Q22HL4_TETTS|nr:transmembrane protein, putative [Tetrahymena thermophila SB210]EAR84687.2 transmembrane protein, putative [Tetrahymena thermophila SB210]|eukprot:XP_001032350.2 transmembrane protein, putative [Tetrahymena thermophila SB210]
MRQLNFDNTCLSIYIFAFLQLSNSCSRINLSKYQFLLKNIGNQTKEMRVIRNFLKIILLGIFCFNKLTQGAYLIQDFINFDEKNCQQFEGYQGKTIGCTMQGSIGKPAQGQVFLFVLYNPLQYSVVDTNLVINSQCTRLSQCPYAVNAPSSGKNFYNQKKSITYQVEGGDYEYIVYDSPYMQGKYSSDIIKLSSNNEFINMKFLSLSNFGLTLYIADGVINLSRGNSDNIFVEGYNQQKLISPKFMFGVKSGSFGLMFNRDFNFESSPSIKTYSNDQWNLQVAGIRFGDDDVIAATHFQTISLNTLQNIYVPYSLAQYIQSKYPQYYSNNEYWSIKNCFACSCLVDFPDIVIYTSEYAITFKMADLTYISGLACNMYISSTNFIFGMQQLIDLGVLFNPLEGSVQMIYNSNTMIHPSISNLYVIMTLASISLFLLILVLLYFEIKLITIKDEFDFFKKIM